MSSSKKSMTSQSVTTRQDPNAFSFVNQEPRPEHLFVPSSAGGKRTIGAGAGDYCCSYYTQSGAYLLLFRLSACSAIRCGSTRSPGTEEVKIAQIEKKSHNF